ncbi:hypothetical protein DICVIV_13198 [Dictyocaulus viviparus]|uniref:Uncharacterized protein n=1 Tax=Dictyocaulus viviparus TaxID=29172 RepID=A0A0D8XEJ1_DICVI|nr:hypothetical protein DICVIV_13198 [Dictyocaulus viviparus]
MRVHPYALMLPVTWMASFTFVLPVGTPPNAIVFSTEMVTIAQMASSGIALSAICIAITVIYLNTFVLIIWPLYEFPTWANPQNSSLLV